MNPNHTKWDRLVNKFVAPLALVGGLLGILFVTLNSFDFTFRSLSTARYFGGFLLYPSSYLDFPLNVLLFMPFGFGLASLLNQAGLSKKATLLAVFLAGFCLTWLVESLQFFLPGRTPNVADLMANTLGALAGLGGFRIWNERRRFLPVVLQPRYLVFCLIIYLILLLGLGFVLREKSRLMDWQPRFPLVIGNEKTGNRAWTGSVTDLMILDRALSSNDVQRAFQSGRATFITEDALVAYYSLRDAADLADRTGNLPDLRWIGAGAQQLDGRNWLRTGWAAVTLEERLVSSSQFSVLALVATADLQQTGPARIISVSATPYYRNLTLGQEGRDLVVRVRTPLTGFNGTLPEMIIPDIFSDEEPHELIVTYDGLDMSVYVDQAYQAQSVQMVPGTAFFYALIGPFKQTVGVNPTSSKMLMLLFYLLAFVPAGFLLALTAVQVRNLFGRILLLALGISLPALLLEGVLSTRIGFELRPVNVLLAAAVTAVSFLLLIPAARKVIDQQ